MLLKSKDGKWLKAGMGAKFIKNLNLPII